MPMGGKSFDSPGDRGALTFDQDGVNPIIKAGDVTINATESCLAENSFWDEANPGCPEKAAVRATLQSERQNRLLTVQVVPGIRVHHPVRQAHGPGPYGPYQTSWALMLAINHRYIYLEE